MLVLHNGDLRLWEALSLAWRSSNFFFLVGGGGEEGDDVDHLRGHPDVMPAKYLTKNAHKTTMHKDTTLAGE